jgi:hypothetical protein
MWKGFAAADTVFAALFLWSLGPLKLATAGSKGTATAT